MQQDFIINRQPAISKIRRLLAESIVRYLSSPLYICREPSTNQLLFMQNKPNFRKSQMNLKFCKQMDYEYKRDWTIGQNKPNSNPIKPNFLKRWFFVCCTSAHISISNATTSWSRIDGTLSETISSLVS